MKKLFIVLALLCFNSFVNAQSDSLSAIKSSIIVLVTGDQIVGKIISDDGREILIMSEKVGKLYIQKSQIKEIRSLEESKALPDGDYILESPFTTRYAFTANALPIKKNVNYAMVNLYGPEIHFALTNKFSLGVMTTWLGSPLGLVGKYTFPTKNTKLNFAAGTILGTSGYLFKGRGYGGLGWLTTTYGGRLSNVSFSAGYGFVGSTINSDSYKGGPLFSIGAFAQIGKKASFVFDSMLSSTTSTETTYTPVYDGNGNYIGSVTATNPVKSIAFFLMPGMRFSKTESKAFQISLAGVIYKRGSESRSFPIPMCSWFFKL